MRTPEYVTVATRIRDRMVETGHNPNSLSTEAGLERNYVRSALRGLSDPSKGFVPKIDKLRLIARELGCSVDYLLGDSNDLSDPSTETPGLDKNGNIDAGEKTVKSSPGVEASRAGVGRPHIAALARDVPVFGTAAGSLGMGAQQLVQGEVVNYVSRFPGIEREKDVYALYVEGDSMVPRYHPGELIYAAPHRPPRIGDYVIVQVQAGENEPIEVYIKRLVRRSASKIELEQYNPAKTFEIDAGTVVAVHRILDTNALMGA